MLQLLLTILFKNASFLKDKLYTRGSQSDAKKNRDLDKICANQRKQFFSVVVFFGKLQLKVSKLMLYSGWNLHEERWKERERWNWHTTTQSWNNFICLLLKVLEVVYIFFRKIFQPWGEKREKYMQIQNDTVFNRLLVVMTFICLIRDEYLSNRPCAKMSFF